MNILHRDDLPRGGFAGLKEHRIVTDRKVWGRHAERGAWDGLGNFVYLADATFMPKGETKMHGHHEIDVISFMIDGRVAHEGSLEHGELLQNYDVQVQRAGGEGFKHNEVNPDDEWNRMLQLWVTPEKAGQPADYKKYEPKSGQLTRIYGGPENQSSDEVNTQDQTFSAKTEISVALLNPKQELQLDGEFMAYVSKGSGIANEQEIKEGDLFTDTNLNFQASDNVHMVVIQANTQ